MVEESFEIRLSTTPQNDKFYYFSVILSPWLKKILKFDFLKRPKMALILLLFCHTFTMVEENFEI